MANIEKRTTQEGKSNVNSGDGASSCRARRWRSFARPTTHLNSVCPAISKGDSFNIAEKLHVFFIQIQLVIVGFNFFTHELLLVGWIAYTSAHGCILCIIKNH